MPSVMIGKNAQGQLTFYVPKKDLEDVIVSMEHEGPGTWGGKIVLGEGDAYYIEPLPTPPSLPITLRAKRAGEED